MLGFAAGTAIPPSVRFALMAIALDVGAVASFALAVILGFNPAKGSASWSSPAPFHGSPRLRP